MREADARNIGTLDFSSKEIESTEWLARNLAAVPPWLRALRGFSALGSGGQTRDLAAGRISEARARRTRRRGLLVAIARLTRLRVMWRSTYFTSSSDCVASSYQ